MQITAEHGRDFYGVVGFQSNRFVGDIVMEPLSREMSIIAAMLEEHWNARISMLERQGKTYGDQDYDAASANLCAIADEFWIWNED